jgi:hypothetical protein
MSKYYCKTTYDIKEIPQDLYDQWVSLNNPKAESYALLPAKPSDDAVWTQGEWVLPTVSEEIISEEI